MVLEVLKQNQLFVKMSKCDFGATQVEYMGHVINRGTFSMDAKKVVCKVEWPVPTSVKELKGFLGLTGYYRKFIRGYGVIIKPLTDLLKINGFQRTFSSLAAFEKLKTAMVIASVLVLPDFTKVFTIEADASNHGIGVVLSQDDDP